MKAFFLSLLSGDESEVDSAIVCGVLALLVLIGITAWRPDWNPIPYTTGAATIIGMVPVGRRFRDGPKPPGAQ